MMVNKRQSGFTLLYSVLITGLLLAIGLAIVNIAIKEVTLSATSRDAQFAFYAADAGMECALYWELQHDGFATSTDSQILCSGITIGGATDPDCCGGQGAEVPSTFTLQLGPYCAQVSVTKQEIPSRRTIIESRGYNTCTVDSPRRVERALRTRY